MRLVTTALALTDPRFDHTRTQPPFSMPFSLASCLGDLDEELGLQHRVDLDVLRPEVEVLRQPVGDRGIGELLRRRRTPPCRP